MNAQLLHGVVMHERLRPRRNRFSYPVFYLRLNLARLDQCNTRWFGVEAFEAREEAFCQPSAHAELVPAGIHRMNLERRGVTRPHPERMGDSAPGHS